MKDLNLCELLKGHEGETFYTTIFGNAEFTEIHNYNDNFPIIMNDGGFSLSEGGKYTPEGECIIFPSETQRDWEKWKEEQKAKVIPKTWSELVKQFDREEFPLSKTYQIIAYDYADAVSPVLALTKIKQLIEAGYGGNITKEEWEDLNVDKYVIDYCPNDNKEDKIKVGRYSYLFNHIAFHTREQAKKFLSYDENIELLKNFYAI